MKQYEVCNRSIRQRSWTGWMTSVLVTGWISLVIPSAATAEGIGLQVVAEGFTSPTVLAPVPDGSGRMVIADQVGTAHVLTSDGQLRDRLFLDVRDRLTELNQGFDERGLLGLAFHPEFSDNRRLFVYYSAPLRSEAPQDWNHTSHISEFKVFPDEPLRVDPDSERIVLQVDEPQFNHDAGGITFGPDGYLYVPLGDGGQANDMGVGHPPQGNGQDTTTLLGSILRLDVDGKQPYDIPSDNPFVGREGRDEIYAYGLRNPWGISFDQGGEHELFAADVGQNAFEEVNLIVKGGNYGWRIREGDHCFNVKNPNEPLDDCPEVGERGEPLLPPIVEYKNFKAFRKDPDAKGISVVGGYVYRGKALEELQGRYIFADWSANWALAGGTLFAASRSESGENWTMEPLSLADHPDGQIEDYIVAVGQDLAGEIYVLTNGRNSLTGETGKVMKLVPAGR